MGRLDREEDLKRVLVLGLVIKFGGMVREVLVMRVLCKKEDG